MSAPGTKQTYMAIPPEWIKPAFRWVIASSSGQGHPLK